MTNVVVSRRYLLGGLALVGASGLSASPLFASPPIVKVARNPGCGCCLGWGRHLEANGFKVDMSERRDMAAFKVSLGVPPELESCHTGLVEGYVIEGHVPVEAIKRLLTQKPDSIGLAVPGMPIGSPGMEGGKPEVYEVIIFSKSGTASYGRWKGSAAI